MSTTHHWFQSGSYSLPAHVDRGPAHGAGIGALIVPPFGWEDICSYRPLYLLARMFADSGIPAMRFDLPGTGDSSGSPEDPDIFASWVRSVGDAASELQAVSGAQEVALVGIRLGGLLAALAARETPFRNLVIWGAPLTGRGLLREWKARHQLEAGENSNPELHAIPNGLETAGFFVGAELKAALEAVDLSIVRPIQGGRVLLLSCDNLPVDRRLAEAFRLGRWHVEMENGVGYSGMMAHPHEAVVPTESGRTIVSFLRDGASKSPQEALKLCGDPKDHSCEITADHGAGITEELHTIMSSSGSAFAVLSKPVLQMSDSEWCLLLLNAGAVRHIGPNRMWVETARRWAARGLPSLRIDLPGIGEGSGHQNPDIADLYRDDLLREVQRVLLYVTSRLGARKLIVAGLCSGAFCAFHAAVRNPEVRGAILLNPRLFFWDPEVDRRRILRRMTEGITDSTTWRRLARGEFSSAQMKDAAGVVFDKLRNIATSAGASPQIPRDRLQKALDVLRGNQTKMTLIFSEEEPLYQEMEEEGYLPLRPESLFRCVRSGNSGHTFRPLWSQKLAHGLIDAEIRNIMQLAPRDLDLPATFRQAR